MASTNQTTHYGLPQYIGTDQAEWTDTNTPFSEVDSDLYTAKQNADSALAGIDSVALEVNDLKVSVLGLKSSILGLRTDVNFNTANITDAKLDIDTLKIDVAKLKLDVTDLVVSELPKKIDTFSGVVEDDQQTSYTAVTADGIAYDETNQQLLLKVDGADTVIPFSRGGGGGGGLDPAKIDIRTPTTQTQNYNPTFDHIDAGSVFILSMEAPSSTGCSIQSVTGGTVRGSRYQPGSANQYAWIIDVDSNATSLEFQVSNVGGSALYVGYGFFDDVTP